MVRKRKLKWKQEKPQAGFYFAHSFPWAFSSLSPELSKRWPNKPVENARNHNNGSCPYVFQPEHSWLVCYNREWCLPSKTSFLLIGASPGSFGSLSELSRLEVVRGAGNACLILDLTGTGYLWCFIVTGFCQCVCLSYGVFLYFQMPQMLPGQ